MTGAWLRGEACALDTAVDAAAEVLATARLPLVYGLVESTVEAQREAVRLARLARGILDTAVDPGGAREALERAGHATASLGEMRLRADLVVFWACDPDRLHPGFVERYAPARGGRARLAIDIGAAAGPAAIPDRLALPAGRELEALLVLRAFVRGRRVEVATAEACGLPLDALRLLGQRLRGCGYGAIVHDAGGEAERALALVLLAREARRQARLRLVGVRMPGNPAGAENVLAWLTGFPAAMSFARGDPRYGPGEFTAEAVLAGRDVDAALVVGADPGRHLSSAALAHLGRIPTVWIGTPSAPDGAAGRVSIGTAPLAATAGHVFRMDGIALSPRPQPEDAGAGLPLEAAVLARIAVALEGRVREGAR